MKSKAASFKVNIGKIKTTDLHKRSRRLVEKLSHKQISRTGYHKHEGVNFYVSSKHVQLLPDPPEEIIAFIRSKINAQGQGKIEQLLLKGNEKRAVKEKKRKKNSTCRINEFIAFRSYYSKFFNGILSQTEISSIISKHWAANAYTRKLWDVIAQKYNCEQTTMAFNDWMEYHYTSSKKWIKKLECLSKTERSVQDNAPNQKPYIENIFVTQIEKKCKDEVLTENLLDLEEIDMTNFGLLGSVYNFEEFGQTNCQETFGSVQENTDLYSILNPI